MVCIGGGACVPWLGEMLTCLFASGLAALVIALKLCLCKKQLLGPGQDIQNLQDSCPTHDFLS